MLKVQAFVLSPNAKRKESRKLKTETHNQTQRGKKQVDQEPTEQSSIQIGAINMNHKKTKATDQNLNHTG